jgi:putative mRNA 3-end processing factor
MKIVLDPSQPVDCDFTFVSHAHVDHLHKRSRKKSVKTQVIASKETALIAQARGYQMADTSEEQDGFQLVDTGHILGSRGLLIGDNDVYYTGDLSIRERAFMKPAKMPRAKTLIIESTFGRPEYVFPALSEVTHRTNKIISEMYDLGIPVILMGYTLGKAQLLTELFGHWDPVYVHDSVAKMNSVYSELGVQLKNAVTHSEAEERGLLSKNKPWVMVAPLMHSRNAFIKEMKDRHGAVTIGFTGWAVGSRYKYMMGLDYVMPLSDHCDYKELVDAVKQCRPDKVYTFHGFAAEFAKSLRAMGFDAQPVGNGKSEEESLSLDSFQ